MIDHAARRRFVRHFVVAVIVNFVLFATSVGVGLWGVWHHDFDRALMGGMLGAPNIPLGWWVHEHWPLFEMIVWPEDESC